MASHIEPEALLELYRKVGNAVQAKLPHDAVADAAGRRQRHAQRRLKQLLQVLAVGLVGVAAVALQGGHHGAVVEAEHENTAAGAEVELGAAEQPDDDLALAAVQVVDEDDEAGVAAELVCIGARLEELVDRVLEEQMKALTVAEGGESVLALLPAAAHRICQTASELRRTLHDQR